MPSLPLVSDQYQRRWSSEQSRKSAFYDVNRYGPNPPGATKTASARSTTLTAIFVGLVPSGVNYGRAHHYENQANRRPRNQDWGDTCVMAGNKGMNAKSEAAPRHLMLVRKVFLSRCLTSSLLLSPRPWNTSRRVSTSMRRFHPYLSEHA
jgi:hypothetical protein